MLSRIILVAMAIALLQGCGRKGPLTLPPAPAPETQQTAPQARQPASPDTQLQKKDAPSSQQDKAQ